MGLWGRYEEMSEAGDQTRPLGQTKTHVGGRLAIWCCITEHIRSSGESKSTGHSLRMANSKILSKLAIRHAQAAAPITAKGAAIANIVQVVVRRRVADLSF
jgi:hypothetical protein